jgi:hypothetical protein
LQFHVDAVLQVAVVLFCSVEMVAVNVLEHLEHVFDAPLWEVPLPVHDAEP